MGATIHKTFSVKGARKAIRTASGTPAASRSVALRQILLPSAKDRWQGYWVNYYTPQRIEMILRWAAAGDMLQQWQMFDLMERTWPRLQGNLRKLKDKAASVGWMVQPWYAKGAKPTPEAVRRADLLEDAINTMRPSVADDENDFEGTVWDLADAWGKGTSLLEILWEPRDNMIAPRATRFVTPNHYGFWSTKTQPDAIRFKADDSWLANQSSDPMDLIPDKFLLGVAKGKSGHPAGAALLQPLAFFWAAMNFSWEWFLNYAQIFGIPIRFATYSDNASQETIAEIDNMLENMGSMGWANLPAGTTLDIKEPSKTSGNHPQESIITAANTACDILILGQTLAQEAGDIGSQALGKVHADVMSDREQALIGWTARMLNLQLVPAFCRLNFGDTKEAPQIVADCDEGPDAQTLGQTILVAQKAGLQVSKHWAHDKLGIPIPEPGEEVLEPVAPQMAGMAGGHEEPDGDEDEEGNEPADDTDEEEDDEVSAKAATDQLIDNTLERLTGIQARWLGGVRPFFAELIAKALDKDVTDADFVKAVEHAKKQMPDLFHKLNPDALAVELEASMGAACVNGAVKGFMKRQGKQ
jgi:phage gp29-like protein